MEDSVILRYGEIGLKSARKRFIFEQLYMDALKEALERNEFKKFTIINLGGRFIVEHEKASSAAEILKNVPGVQSLSPSYKMIFDKREDLIQKVKELAASWVIDKTFRIVVNRIGNHSFSSMDIEKEI